MEPEQIAQEAFANPDFPRLNENGICGAEHPDYPGLICEVPANRCYVRHQAVVHTSAGVVDRSWENPRPYPTKQTDKAKVKGIADRVAGSTSAPPPLVDPGQPDAGLRSDPHDTEIKAAEVSKVNSGTWRRKVLDVIVQAGENGMIDYDIAKRIDLMEPRVASRRGELASYGWVEDSGMRRLTGTGSEAIVWVLTPQGHSQYKTL